MRVSVRKSSSTILFMQRYGASIAVLFLAFFSVLSRCGIVFHAGFYWDDFIILAKTGSSLQWSTLWASHDGHTMPGAIAAEFYINAFRPYAWWLPAAILILLYVLQVYLLWKLSLALVFPSRNGHARYVFSAYQRRFLALIPFTMMAFSPLTFSEQAWWSAALNTVPLSLALTYSLIISINTLNNYDCPNDSYPQIQHDSQNDTIYKPGRKYMCKQIGAVIACIVAIGFYEKAIIIPWIVLGVVLIDTLYRYTTLPHKNHGELVTLSWKKRIHKSINNRWLHVRYAWSKIPTSLWSIWLGCALITGIYGGWIWYRVNLVPGQRDMHQGWNLTLMTAQKIFPSSFFGGPWLWEKFPPAPPIVTDFIPAICIFTLVMLFFFRFAYRHRILGIIACVIGYFFLTTTPVYYARSGPHTSGLLAASLRYHTDFSLIIGVGCALCIRYAHRATKHKNLPLTSGWSLWISICVIGSLLSAHNLAAALTYDSSRPYIAGIRAEIHHQKKFFDQPLPFYLLTPLVGENDSIARVFTSLHPQIVSAKTTLEVIGDDGHLHTIYPIAVRTLQPGCTPDHRISGPLFDSRWIVHVAFHPQPTPTTITVSWHSPLPAPSLYPPLTVTIPAHAHDIYISTQGTGKDIRIVGLSCITQGDIFPPL